MPYEDDYKMWLEKSLIEMNPDWICDGMHDTEFTHDWCYKYCGKDDLYITPKCLHMYYHHIVKAEQTEPQTDTHDIRTETHECVKDTHDKVETMSCQECKWWFTDSLKHGGYCQSLLYNHECRYEPEVDCSWK